MGGERRMINLCLTYVDELVKMCGMKFSDTRKKKVTGGVCMKTIGCPWQRVCVEDS